MSYLDARLGGEDPRSGLIGTTPLSERRLAVPGDHATIRCRSEVTGLHAANLVTDLADAADRACVVFVDLSLTTRIDAAGLGALVSGARACRDAGSELCIVGAAGMVARALRFTGLSSAFSTYALPDQEVEEAPDGSGVDEPWTSRGPAE